MNATIVHRVLLHASKHIVHNIEVDGTTVTDKPFTPTFLLGDMVSVRQMKKQIKVHSMMTAGWAMYHMLIDFKF